MNGADGGGTPQGTAVVTGGNRGVGRAVVRELALRGFRVVLHARTPARAQATVEELSPVVGRRHLEPVAADLERPVEVEQALGAIRARHERIQVLVHSAGVAMRDFRRTEEGLETSLAVNHLGTVRTTLGLLPLLLAGAPARVVVLSSLVHARRHDPSAFDRVGFGGRRAYAQTKFLNLAFTFDLARALEGSGVDVNAVHPGTLRTGLLEDFIGGGGALARLTGRASRLLSARPERGADTPVYAATDPGLAGRTGLFLRKRRDLPVRGDARDPAVQERVHDWTRELTGVSWREVAQEALAGTMPS